MGNHSLLQGIFPTQVSCIAGRFFTSWATREAWWSELAAFRGFPGGTNLVEKPACPSRGHKRPRLDPWVSKIPWRYFLSTDSSILAWRIPWTEEPGGLQSIEYHRVRQNWSDIACTLAAFLIEHGLYFRKWLAMFIQYLTIWKRGFLENKIRLLLQGEKKKKKNLLESVAIDKLWTSQQTLVFWKMYLYHLKLDTFSTLRIPLRRLLVLLTNIIFKILYRDHLKELHKSVNQLVLKWPVPMML